MSRASEIQFEPVPKKLEVWLHPHTPEGFLSVSHDFWDDLIHSAQATVVHREKSSHALSYVLGESSFLVTNKRMLMLTCGQTRLIDAVVTLMQRFSREQLRFLKFVRPFEFFPHRQSTTFEEDSARLKELLPSGESYLLNNGSYRMFQMGSQGSIEFNFEIYMRDATFSFSKSLINNVIQDLSDFFSGFEHQSHFFQPTGFSLNAIKADEYFFFHVSPEPECAFVHLESNVNLKPEQIDNLAQILAASFSPGQIEVVKALPTNRPSISFDRLASLRSSSL